VCGLIPKNFTFIEKMTNSAANRKRKLIIPRFISCKHLKQTMMADSEACFESFPQELFCKIVSFIGPTSSSLCAIAQLSRYYHEMMSTIGDVMLERAKLRFRTPLAPKCHSESSISLFVRHSQVAKDVHDNLETLESILEKEFPFTDISITDGEIKNKAPQIIPLNDAPDTIVPLRPVVVEPDEVENALNVALCLLGAGREHYFGDKTKALHISNNGATTALEWRVSSICGKLGARAYKYFKARILSFNEQETDEMFSTYTVSDEFQLEHRHLEQASEAEHDFRVETRRPEEAKDWKRLEKSCFVMQLVVLRDIENASEICHGSNNSDGGEHRYESWLREQQTSIQESGD